MVDQPNHRSYKIRGHTRLRKSSKPYSRPNEPKNKGLLDKVKDYLSPSWLFGYFTSNEDECEPSNFEDDALDENATVTHEEGGSSSSCIPDQDRLASLEEENDEDDAFEKDNDTNTSGDKVLDANNTRQDKVEKANTSIRLSGCLNDDIEDENEKQVQQQTDRPQQSLLSYSTDQLTRKPLPSLHYRSTSSSLLQQRGTPSLLSQGKSLLRPMSTGGNSFTPSLKLSTPMVSSGTTGFSSAHKSISSQTKSGTSLTRSSSLKDNFTRAKSLTAFATPRLSKTTSSSALSRPDVAGDSAPLFSVEKFVTPVQRTFTNKRVGSPSYPGPVMYGGALNVSRDVPFKRRRTSSPGSESFHSVSNLRIRGVKEKTIQNTTVGGTGTRTAQRILDALESVSSPLKDVRRIPSPISLASASPLSFMPSKMRITPPKTKVGPRVSYLQAKLLGDPPVSSLQTPDVAKVSFVEDSTSREPQPSSPPSSPPRKASKKPVADQTFFSGLKDTVLKSSLPTSFAPKSLPTSLSPIENSGKSSGKMRTAPRSAAMHYSSYKNNQDEELVNPLPEIRNAVPLPVNPGRNMSLPMFNTNKTNGDAKPTNKSENIFNKQKESSSNGKLLTESPKNGFIFSTPQPKSQRFSVKESLEVADDEVSFAFSEPVPVKTNSDNVKETFTNPLLQTQTPSNSFKPTADHSTKSNAPFSRSLLRNDTTDSGSSKILPTKTSEKSEPAQTNNLSQRFAPAAGSWECTSCLVNNNVDAVKCVACETAKPSAKKTGNTSKDKQEKQEHDLKAKFAPPKDTWECETCLVRNKNELNKCAACETKRPGTSGNDDLKLKFAAPSDSWECPTCMLRNKAADLKCVACAASKPGSSSSDNLKLKFAAPSGSWECSTCLVQNKAADSKCVACQANKPGTESSGSSQTGFTFGQTSATSGFTFGASDASKSTSSSGFTFGNSNTGQSADPPNTSTFTFGQGSSETTTKANPTFISTTTASGVSKPTSGFTFGGSSGEKPATKPTFTFGAGSTNEGSKPTFSFGASNSENASSQNDGLQKEENKDKPNEKPAPAMNIAQAAAAGLLKVPGKDATPAQDNVQVPAQAQNQALKQSQATTEPPTVPNFTFGGGNAASAGPGEQRADVKASGLGFTPIPSSTAQVTPFAFQSTAASTASTNPSAGGLFTFGAQPTAVSAVTSSTAKSLFSFTGGTNPTVPSVNTQLPSGSGKNTPFSFTPSNTPTTLPNATTTDPVLPKANSIVPFNFSGSLPSAKTTVSSNQSNPAPFSFTGATSTDQAKPASLFNFGAVNGPTSSNGPNVVTAPTGTGLFSFTGSQQQSTAPVVENQNSMGGEEMDADSNNNHDQNTFPQTTGGFNFSAPTAGNTSSIFSAGTNATPGGTQGGFHFNANSGIAPTFQFGSNNSTPSGGFNFGGAAPTGGSTFMFGATSTPASGPANSSTTPVPFNFGPTSAPTKPQQNVGQSTAQPNMFNIGATQTAPATPRVYKRGVRRNRR